EEWDVSLDRQAEEALNVGLANGFAINDGLRREVLRDVWIGGRVPRRVVDAVDDPAQAVAALVEHAFHSATKRWRADLVCVGRTDRVHPVREDDPALEQVELAVELELVWVVEPEVESGQVEQLVWERTLEGDVVDREQGAHAAIVRPVSIEFAQV